MAVKSRSPANRRKDGFEYVEKKLSSLPATVGKETSHGNDPLSVRQVRLERLELKQAELASKQASLVSILDFLYLISDEGGFLNAGIA